MVESVTIACPYCGEQFESSVDLSAGPCRYVEDCAVCCRPIEVRLEIDEDGVLQSLETARGDD